MAGDHRPLLLKTNAIDSSRPRPFRFEKFWTGIPSSFDVVGHECGKQVRRAPSLQVFSKLKDVEEGLKSWNKTVVGNIFERASSLNYWILLVARGRGM